ncbi:MAG: hypothetical protein R2695_21825 [Acidimicrobiales bacterium]
MSGTDRAVQHREQEPDEHEPLDAPADLEIGDRWTRRPTLVACGLRRGASSSTRTDNRSCRSRAHWCSTRSSFQGASWRPTMTGTSATFQPAASSRTPVETVTPCRPWFMPAISRSAAADHGHARPPGQRPCVDQRRAHELASPQLAVATVVDGAASVGVLHPTRHDPDLRIGEGLRRHLEHVGMTTMSAGISRANSDVQSSIAWSMSSPRSPREPRRYG